MYKIRILIDSTHEYINVLIMTSSCVSTDILKLQTPEVTCVDLLAIVLPRVFTMVLNAHYNFVMVAW